MSNLRDEILKKYNTDIDLISCYSLIYSYARDVELPVIFAHYMHELPVPYNLNNKNRNYCSVYILLTGDLSFISENSIYTPSYGDAVFFRENEGFTSCFHSVSHLDYYEISFRKEFFEKSPFADMFAKPFYNRKSSEQNMLVLDKRNRGIIIEKLQEVDYILTAKYENSEALAYSYIIQIMDILSYNFSHTETSQSANKIPSKLNDAISYIHENFQTISGINEICEACGFSDSYLERIFKIHLSCTPIEYMTKQRIAYSKHLLAIGESVTDACFKSGFNNYNYFISKFKSIIGTTPAKFKKEQV